VSASAILTEQNDTVQAFTQTLETPDITPTVVPPVVQFALTGGNDRYWQYQRPYNPPARSKKKKEVEQAVAIARVRVQANPELTRVQIVDAERVLLNVVRTVREVEEEDLPEILIEAIWLIGSPKVDQDRAIENLEQIERAIEDEHAAVLLLLAA
jgi:hypothetical protein